MGSEEWETVLSRDFRLREEAAAELSALRALRDAVGVFMACNEPLSNRYHDAKVAMRKAYQKCEVTNDGK